MRLRAFADVIAERQGGINLKPGKAYKRVLTRNEVIDIFGDVPEHSVRYGLSISVNKLNENRYEVVVKRIRG